MNNLPRAITFPQFPSITAYNDDGEGEEEVFMEDIAKQYLQSLIPRLAQIKHVDCGIRMVSFTLGERKQNKGKQ